MEVEMNNKRKKLIAKIIVIVLIISMVGTAVFAAVEMSL